MEKLLELDELYQEDPNLKKEDVKVLLKWWKQQKHFPVVSELHAAFALHSAFYSIECAKTRLENYFTIRSLCSQFYGLYDPEKDQLLKRQLHVLLLTVLPEKSLNGYVITFARLLNKNPEAYSIEKFYKQMDMLAMLGLYTHGPGDGVILIVDLSGFVLRHLAKLNLLDFKKFSMYSQEALPLRIMEVHFINVVPFMDKIMSLLKPFIKKDLYNKLYIHTNIETLYKVIPKTTMPAEYGGNAESINIMADKMRDLIYKNKWFFDILETHMTDESKRIGSKRSADDLFGIDGTFKQLQVD